MRNRIVGSLVALIFVAPVGVVLTATSAEAAPRKFSSCTALTKVYPDGVAKSRKAAKRQVRQGNSRPAFGPRARKVYWANRANLDRDRDGTACES